MKIYWRQKDIPELASLPPEKRRAAYRACYEQAIRLWPRGVGWLACLLGAALGFFVGCLIVPYSVSISSFVRALAVGIGVGIGGFIFQQLVAHQMRPYLREYLKGRIV